MFPMFQQQTNSSLWTYSVPIYAIDACSGFHLYDGATIPTTRYFFTISGGTGSIKCSPMGLTGLCHSFETSAPAISRHFS